MALLDRFRMDDQVAIITGAGRGIGQGIALAFAEMGAGVVCAARTEAEIEETAARARAFGRRALAVRCDATEPAQLEALVATTMKEFGRIDQVVNNAGGYPPMPFLETELSSWEWCLKFNLTSAFVLTRAAMPHLLEGEGGAVLNIGSAAGRIVRKNFVAYGTVKAALAFMTKQLGAEFAPKVRVNALAVGATVTEAIGMFLHAMPDMEKQMTDLTPMARLGTPDDIALAVLYLASPAGSWITGKVLEVDGGTIASNWPIKMASGL